MDATKAIVTAGGVIVFCVFMVLAVAVHGYIQLEIARLERGCK